MSRPWALVPDRLRAGQARDRVRKNIDLKTRVSGAKKATVEAKPARKRPARPPSSSRCGDRPRTAFVRDVLGKADGTPGRILGGE